MEEEVPGTNNSKVADSASRNYCSFRSMNLRDVNLFELTLIHIQTIDSLKTPVSATKKTPPFKWLFRVVQVTTQTP